MKPLEGGEQSAARSPHNPNTSARDSEAKVPCQSKIAHVIFLTPFPTQGPKLCTRSVGLCPIRESLTLNTVFSVTNSNVQLIILGGPIKIENPNEHQPMRGRCNRGARDKFRQMEVGT